MIDYPEHDKLHNIKEYSQTIGEFLDWLDQKGISLCEFVDDLQEYEQVYKSNKKLLAEYFKIDLDKIEKEKQQMLDEVRTHVVRVAKEE